MKRKVNNSSKNQARKDIRDIEARLAALEDKVEFEAAETLVLASFMYKHGLLPYDEEFPDMVDHIRNMLRKGDFPDVVDILGDEIEKSSVIKDLIAAAHNGSDHPIDVFNWHTIYLGALANILIKKGIVTQKELTKYTKKTAKEQSTKIDERWSLLSKQEAA